MGAKLVETKQGVGFHFGTHNMIQKNSMVDLYI